MWLAVAAAVAGAVLWIASLVSGKKRAQRSAHRERIRRENTEAANVLTRRRAERAAEAEHRHQEHAAELEERLKLARPTDEDVAELDEELARLRADLDRRR